MVPIEWIPVQVGASEMAIRTRGELPEPGATYLWPSVGEYPVYDDYLYHVMLEDDIRNVLFREAIAVTCSGKTVADIGSGPDLLWSLAALHAGAVRVYAIEASEESAREAERVTRANSRSDLAVIHGRSCDITLPERAEVCVAELVGNIGGAEGIARTINDAHERLLTRSAVVIPSRVRTLVGAVHLAEILGSEPALAAGFVPYVEAVLQSAARPFDLRLCIAGAEEAHLKSTTGVLEDLQLNEQSYAQGGSLTLEVTRSGPVDALMAWIDMEGAPGGETLNSLTEATNWLPVAIPFSVEERIEVELGDMLTLQVRVGEAEDGIHPDYFFDGYLAKAGSGREISLQAESRYAGGRPGSTPLHRWIMR